MKGEPVRPQAKGPPAETLRRRRKRAWQQIDEEESLKVRLRSGGRCEVEIAGVRCPRPRAHVHHQLGGYGRRGRGASAFAQNKTDCCVECHAQINHGRLVHLAGNHYSPASFVDKNPKRG